MPNRVRIERPDSMAEHRRHEVRAITAVVLVVNGVAAACAIVPAVNDVVTGLVLAVVAAVVGVLVAAVGGAAAAVVVRGPRRRSDR
jgi:hypothetical protein